MVERMTQTQTDLPAQIGLAGLDVWQADQVWHRMRPVFLRSPKFGYTPMPSADAVLAEGLRLICEVAGLTVLKP